MKRFLFLLLFILSGPVVAEVPAISGSTDAAFIDARKAWLDGDDLPALEALKTLAENDNIAAQILLARIAEEPHTHRHVTGEMSRADRIALLRKPGGLSGTSWLEEAKDNSELAAALIGRNVAYSSARTEDGTYFAPEAMDAISTLLEYGEIQLATEVAFKLYDGGSLRELLTLIDAYGEQLDAVARILEAKALVVMAPTMDDPEAARQMADKALEDVDPSHVIALKQVLPQQLFDSLNAQNFMLRYSELVPDWRPLRGLCDTYCAESYDTCMLAGITAIGFSRRFPFTSPLQSVVANEEYWQSARIHGDVSRRLTELDWDFEMGSRFSQCFSDTVLRLAQ